MIFKLQSIILVLAFWCCISLQHSLGQTSYWTPKSSLPDTGRSNVASFVIGSKAYFVAGTFNGCACYLNEVWEYDTTNDLWTKKSNFPGPARFAAAGFTIGNKGYVCGGSSGAVTIGYSDLWEYNPASDTWTSKASFPGGSRDLAIAFSIGAKGYYGTGRLVGSSGNNDDLWEYSPSSDTWSQKTDIPGGGRVSAISFVINNKGYVGFGWGSPPHSDLFEYDPAADSWISKSSGGLTLAETAAFSIGDKAYIATGALSISSTTNQMWSYDPSSDVWTPSVPLPAASRNFANGFNIGNRGYIGLGNIGYYSWVLPNDLYEFSTDDTIPLSENLPLTFIPNIFSPNNDGVNDNFFFVNNELRTYTMEIYNRWGNKLYEFSNSANGWDGKDCPDGIYFYICDGVSIRGGIFKQRGSLTLVR